MSTRKVDEVEVFVKIPKGFKFLNDAFDKHGKQVAIYLPYGWTITGWERRLEYISRWAITATKNHNKKDEMTDIEKWSKIIADGTVTTASGRKPKPGIEMRIIKGKEVVKKKTAKKKP